jgi:small subunit ribosomal protein S9
MADEQTDETPELAEEPTTETPAAEVAGEAVEQPAAQEPTAQEPQEPVAEEPTAEQEAAPEREAAPEQAAPAEEAAPEQQEAAANEVDAQETPAEETPSAEETPAELAEETPSEQASTAEPIAQEPTAEPTAQTAESASQESAPKPDGDALDEDDEDEELAPRVKPAVPGAHLEVDIVPEGVDPLGRERPADPYAIEDEEPQADGEAEEEQQQLAEPISTAAIDLAADARYRATGKRKTAIARVTLRPGSGAYTVNGRALEQFFPRNTLQRNIRQPLEAVGYQERMDVVALLQGGGVSAQAGALRHGISRALLEADPNLRGELKRRGFLTRDSRAKERKKAGLKKARKRPQFSKR